MELGNNEKKRKKNPPKESKEKKKRQRSPDFTRKAQKCNKRLMYKTKGVQPKRYKQRSQGNP